MSDDTKLTFLWNASELFAPNQHVKRLLKSYYLTNIKHLVGDKTSLGSNQFGDRAMCRKCSARWCDGNFTMKHVSSHVKGARAEKLVDALNKGEKLTKKQKIRAKWYRKRINSSVVITCNLCQHKTPLYLEKPKLVEKMAEETQEVEQETKTKTKKKKKDKTAGLKLNPIKTNLKKQSSSATCSKKKIIPPSKAKPEIKLLNTSINIKKAKSISNNSSSKILSKNQTKTVSKTQQKNTLLQLANILKNSTKSNSTGNDRLKNLLR